MKTTQTKLPKVIKQTSTATKRKAISKKEVSYDAVNEAIKNMVAEEIRHQVPLKIKLYQEEMSGIDVPNTKDWNCEGELTNREYRSIFIAVAIFLGIVAGMILITPKVLEVCQ